MIRRRVFVSNLDQEATEEQVATFFELAGTVHLVQIARHPDGASRGCAVVEFKSDKNADIAIEVFDGREHLGRTLNVRAFNEQPNG